MSMGKTNNTYRGHVSEIKNTYSKFERGLREPDKKHWSDLWVHAEQYADAAGYHNPHNPIQTILLSICLGQQKQLNYLEEKLEE